MTIPATNPATVAGTEIGPRIGPSWLDSGQTPPTPSLVHSSAAEHVTFVATSGGGCVEAVIQDFRISAAGGKTYDTKNRKLSTRAGTGIGPRIGPSWPDSPDRRACTRKEATA